MSIESLKGILNPNIICGLNTSNPNEVSVTLVEEQRSKLNPIKLIIPSHSCLIFQLDKPNDRSFSKKSNFLHDNKAGIHQGCDYVVACIYGGVWQFVFIELKSDVTKGAATQLWHTTPFVSYLIELLKTHFPECNPDPSKKVFKYLLFSTDSRDKLKTSTIYKLPSRYDKRGFTIYLGSSPRHFNLASVLRA